MNTDLLKEKIKESGYNVRSFADAVGIDRSTFYRRLNKMGDDFTIKEINQIISTLGLDSTSAVLIFYPKSLKNEILSKGE